MIPGRPAAPPLAANGCMHTLRAIYNHARRSARELPPDPELPEHWPGAIAAVLFERPGR
jgi:hypothetical protein